MVLFYAFFDILLTDVKYRADVGDADALMQPLIWSVIQLQLLTNVDEDKSFKISAGSFIVLATITTTDNKC